ncbi:MAG: hypothetical protein R3A13_05620 [Bdellovibrionota bacterium]
MHRIYGSIKGAASKSVQAVCNLGRVEAKVVHLVPERLKDVLELSPIICQSSRGEILLTPSF